MCKHVASVLYGVGSRLDVRPESLFLLRDVDTAELIAIEMVLMEPVNPGPRRGSHRCLTPHFLALPSTAQMWWTVVDLRRQEEFSGGH